MHLVTNRHFQKCLFTPKNSFFLWFYPQHGEQYEWDPKTHILGRKHVVWRIDRQNRSTCAGWVRRIKRKIKKLKKVTRKKLQHVFFHVFAQTTHVVAAQRGFACVGTRPKFHRNPFRGFEVPGGQNFAFPITLASCFYHSLYYRTSHNQTSE